MRNRRLTRNLVVLTVLAVATTLLVSIESGSETRAGHAQATGPIPGFTIASQTRPGDFADHPAAPVPSPPARTDPNIESLSPYRFRLGLIDGTVVKPDARDWAARTTDDSPLLLFLPATGHVPDDYRQFLRTAAEAGYHVLGLDYFNRGRAVAHICGTDAQCYTQVQRNRFLGDEPGKFSKVDAANGVLSRLRAALAYLQEHDPEGGWDRFGDDGDIDWSRIVVAGHSQGGGEASYIAHEHEVLGQLTFASPIITDVDTRASWLDDPSATPTSRMYAFDSSGDVFYPRIVRSWQELGLTGRITRSAVPVPRTAASHRLVTTMALGDGRLSHLRVVVDSTPLGVDGDPAFAPTWRWLLARYYTDPKSPAVAERQAEKAADSGEAADGAATG